MSEHPIAIERPGHAALRIVATPGRSSITPASRLCLTVIDDRSDLLRGRGLDWGSGTGVLSVAAATHPAVEFILGLELDADEVATARTNAELNGVADRCGFLVSDSYDPFPDQNASSLRSLLGSTDFLIANPPTSPGNDGLGWRRRVLAGALDYLVPGADVLLQVSRQYGTERTQRLATDVGGYEYRELLGKTEWVPFDQSRQDLREALAGYAAEEARSGEKYTFLHPSGDREIDARQAMELYQTTGESSLSQWRMHRLTRLI